MRYCSDCSDSLKWKEIEHRQRQYCPRCGKVFYSQLKVGAGGIIEQDGKILLVRRAQNPFKNSWNLPAGYVENDESPAEAAVREVFEETGLQVEENGLVGVHFFADDPRGNGILIVYQCAIVSGRVRETDEGLQIKYFAKQAIPENLAGGGHAQAILEWSK